MDASEVTRRLRDRTLYASFLAQRNRVNGGCATSIRMENGKGAFSAGLIPQLREGELFTTSEQRDAILTTSACTPASDDVYMVGVFNDNPLSGYSTNGAPLTNLPNRISNDSNTSTMFLACFSSSLDLKWITHIGSESATMNESSIVVGKDGYLYVSATVRQDIGGISSDILFYDAGGASPSITLSPILFPLLEEYAKKKIIIAKYSITGVAQWATYVDTLQYYNNNPSIALDSTNSLYLSISGGDQIAIYQASSNGTSVSTLNYSGIGSYLFKYTTAGEYVWTARIGAETDYTQVMCDKEDNIYITSDSYTNIDVFNSSNLDVPATTIQTINESYYNWIVKYNPLGEYLWVNRFGGADDAWQSMTAIDSQNNLYFMGVYYDTTVSIYNATDINTVVATLPNSGDYDIAIIKYNSDGVYQWATHLSSVRDDREVSIAVDKDDNVVFAGRVSNNNSLDLYDTTSENPIKTMNFATNYSVIVAKYSSLGHHLWSSYVNDSFSESFFYSSVQTDSVGNVYLTATLNAENVGFYDTSSNLVFVLSKTGTDTYHTYVAKFSPSGMPQYATRIVNIYYGNLGTSFKP